MNFLMIKKTPKAIQFIVFSLFIFVFHSTTAQQKAIPVTAFVDPFWGCDGGNTFVGACLPFSLVRLGPDCPAPAPTSGYSSDKQILGFSHTHLSGTGGGGRYGNILVSPTVGIPDLKKRVSIKKSNEFAAPGLYQVTLQRPEGDVECQLTSTPKAGFHSYQPYTWKKEDSIQSNFFFDISHTNSRNAAQNSLDGKIEIIAPNALSGFGFYQGGWGGNNPYKVYFYALFDKPFQSYACWKEDSLWQRNTTQISGKGIGAVVSFKQKQKETILIKVGISLVDRKSVV